MFLINKHIFYVLSLYSNSVILKTPGHLLKSAELFSQTHIQVLRMSEKLASAACCET